MANEGGSSGSSDGFGIAHVTFDVTDLGNGKSGVVDPIYLYVANEITDNDDIISSPYAVIGGSDLVKTINVITRNGRAVVYYQNSGYGRFFPYFVASGSEVIVPSEDLADGIDAIIITGDVTLTYVFSEDQHTAV